MDAEPVLDRLAQARLVLIGSATHGTDEFHRERAALTRELISAGGVGALAVEAAWGDAERTHRYVCSEGDDRSAEQALADVRRFPAWALRNVVVEDFVDWLRLHNAALPPGKPPVSVRGLDIHDPADGPPPAGGGARGFAAERRARAAAAGYEYRRWLPRWPAHAANVRAHHMAVTLAAVCSRLAQDGAPERVVVWAHNGHVGDARATELSRRGERSLGQLVRQRAGAQTILVGLTTYRGTVTAARDWEEDPEEMPLPPAPNGSYEHVLHGHGLGREVLEPVGLPGSRVERAIGGVYRQPAEPAGTYLRARMGDQFDLVVHIDETHAVRSL
jgi:erythromycin esterase-like protein